MAFTSQLKKQLDIPAWQITAPAIAVSGALSSTTSPDNPRLEAKTGRYVYFLKNATNFWKYDTISNGYSQLASPPIAPLVTSSMKFAYTSGFQNSVLSATSTTFTAGIPSSAVGFKMKIISGTGVGQERMITAVSAPTIATFGTCTAADLNSITDANRAFTVNQYAGFLLRTVGGVGQYQTRKILHNSATVLTIANPNLYAGDGLCNSPYVAVAPYAVPTANTTNYQIESSVVTVDTAWDVTPDDTSEFKIFSGGIWLLSNTTAAPFYTLQYFDILSNQWYIMNATGGIVNLAAPAEVFIERTGESASIWVQSKATGGTTTTLIDTSQEWDVNEHVNKYVRIYSGTGRNQFARVLSNTVDTLTFTATLSTAPNATSRYMITGFDGGAVTSAATTSGVSTLTDSTKAWDVNEFNNMSVEIVIGTGAGQERYIRATSTTQLEVWPNWDVVPDTTSRYVIHGNNDDLVMGFTGRPELFFHSTKSGFALRSRNFANGAARGVSAQFAGYSPVAVASASYSNPTLTVTTVNPHNFKTGQVIKLRGDTGAGAAINNLAAGYACTVTGANTFTLAVGAGSAAVTVPAQSTTTLVDGSANWATNQWAGHVVTYNTTQGPASIAHSTAIIASNTATTLTFVVAGVAPVQGISRYSITAAPTNTLKAMVGAYDSGVATGAHSTTTLQDTSKTWPVNGLINRYVVFVGGVGQAQASLITSNTANTITFTAVTTAAVSAQTVYAITGQTSLTGGGAQINWVYGNGAYGSKTRGKYIIKPRGGALLGFERLDIRTDTIELLQPQDNFETFGTGVMSAYDGANTIIFSKDVIAATQLRLYAYNIDTNSLYSCGVVPFSATSTITVGNRLEIFELIDSKKAGVKFVWLNKHTLTECVRTLFWWE